MKKYWIVTAVLLLMSVTLLACSNSDNEQASNDNESNVNEENEHEANNPDNEHDEEENDEDESENSENANSPESENEDDMISGTVTAVEDEKVIRVEAETNMEEGTKFAVQVNKAFGELDSSAITGMRGNNAPREYGEVQNDGTISIDYPMSDDFFDDFVGEDIEVEFKSDTQPYKDHVIEANGEYGENLTGPFVYQFDSIDDRIQNRIYTNINMVIGDGKTEYPIEAPDIDPEPDDYGDTEVWVDAEVVDSDDRFLYIEGKSNLLEGLQLQARYHPEKAYNRIKLFNTNVPVEPDGTFMLPVNYDSITSDGYIEVWGNPEGVHRTKDHLLLEEYGEGFKALSGDVVKKVDGHKEIYLKIDREGLDLDLPDESFATEDGGELKVQVPEEVLFDFDESDLKNDAKGTLDDVVNILEDLDDDASIEVNGHTDNEGEPAYNLDLSEDRAGTVEEYLTNNGDVDHLSIDRNGYGETKPIASNGSKEGRAQNRRVAIVIDNEE